MNTDYIINDREGNYVLTDINFLGSIKAEGDEWCCFTKRFSLSALPSFAAIRFDSRGVCAAYVNGEYVAANTGRYINRITYAECTSRLKVGDNEIKLLLGGHFYQTSNEKIKSRRKTYFSAVAACLELVSDKGKTTYPTDSSWTSESDLGVSAAQCLSQITRAEYERFWLSAALWKEKREIIAPKAILDAIGGYGEYISKPDEAYAYPLEIFSTNMIQKEDHLSSAEALSEVVYRFDKTYCGYVELEYEAEADGEVELRFDYTGYPEDIDYNSPEANVTAKRLTVKKPLRAGRNTLILTRRRAPTLYMSLHFNVKLKLFSARIRLDMLHHDTLGYFNCSEKLFGDMWETGKYTHHVCKHQAFESCPRNEMKYFSGDGIVASLVDAYVFGDNSTTPSSFSYTEPTNACGIVSDPLMRNTGLSEYPAWRIIHAYNYYRYKNDVHFVKQYFDDLAVNIDWMVGKLNANGLFYQYPIFGGHFYVDNESTDYSQNPDRIGEKPLTNAAIYKALLCMAEFAELLGDDRAEKWRNIAANIKRGINDLLWSEEKQAYIEPLNSHYVPQDGNALCLLFGIAEGERSKAIMKTLRDKLWTPYGSTIISEPDAYQFCGNDVISPTMNTYEAEARFLLGDEEGALELMRRCWGSMMKRGAKTFWEYTNVSDGDKPKWYSICHAWSAGCTYLLSAYVLGIRPLSPGYGSLLFAPAASLEGFEGVVPTPLGLVGAKCETVGDEKLYTLVIPKGAKIKTSLPASSRLEVIEY